jgi:serine/threonine protein kinase
MRQLNHKNIVRLIDFTETQEHFFIVLELIAGGELFHEIVRLTYFSEDLSRHVIKQVAEAVRYLHEEAGVVHRDIKPENLLFCPAEFVPSKMKSVRKGEDESKEDEGEFIPGVGAGGIGVIKLADFGLSKIIWDSKTMTPCGTVGYTAPEIVKDERYSKSVDMWALGCVLYTILCGFPPFYDESIEVLTEKVAKGQYTFLSPWWDEISKGAKDLVSHLLTVDPDSRYTINEFLQHPWILEREALTTPAADAPHAHPQPMISEPEDRAEKEYVSPVVVALKEVFDVSNAVHRMEEENARTSRRRFLDQIVVEEDMMEEEEEEDPALAGVEKRFEQVSVGQPTTHVAPVNVHGVQTSTRKPRKGAIPRAMGGRGFFELNLEGATLIERRKRAGKPPIPSLVS